MESERLVSFLSFLDVNILDRNNTAADVLFKKLHEWTTPWATGPEDLTSSADNVMYALHPEHGRWAAARVPAEDVSLWEALDIEPHVAGRWVAAGLDVADIITWRHFCIVDEIDPMLVASWVPFVNFSINEVSLWVSKGVSGDAGAPWFAAGWSDVRVGDVVEWIKAFDGAGFDPADLLVNYETGSQIESVIKWAHCGIVGHELEAFERKGYTSDEAGMLRDSGINHEDAPVKADRNEMLAAKVTGRSWSIIWRKAQDRGWDIVNVDRAYHNLTAVDLVCSSGGAKMRVWFENGKFWRANRTHGGRPQQLKMRELLDLL